MQFNWWQKKNKPHNQKKIRREQHDKIQNALTFA